MFRTAHTCIMRVCKCGVRVCGCVWCLSEPSAYLAAYRSQSPGELSSGAGVMGSAHREPHARRGGLVRSAPQSQYVCRHFVCVCMCVCVLFVWCVPCRIDLFVRCVSCVCCVCLYVVLCRVCVYVCVSLTPPLAEVSLDSLMDINGPFNGYRRYAETKLLNILFSKGADTHTPHPLSHLNTYSTHTAHSHSHMNTHALAHALRHTQCTPTHHVLTARPRGGASLR